MAPAAASGYADEGAYDTNVFCSQGWKSKTRLGPAGPGGQLSVGALGEHLSLPPPAPARSHLCPSARDPPAHYVCGPGFQCTTARSSEHSRGRWAPQVTRDALCTSGSSTEAHPRSALCHPRPQSHVVGGRTCTLWSTRCVGTPGGHNPGVLRSQGSAACRCPPTPPAVRMSQPSTLQLERGAESYTESREPTQTAWAVWRHSRNILEMRKLALENRSMLTRD